jgi:hypothetical protein
MNNGEVCEIRVRRAERSDASVMGKHCTPDERPGLSRLFGLKEEDTELVQCDKHCCKAGLAATRALQG